MKKLEFIDLVRELVPPTHRMTIEKLAAIVYADSLKAIAQKSPNGLSQFRKTYTVNVVDGVATIPIPYISIYGSSVIIPSDDMLYVPVSEEEMNLLEVIDDIDTVIKYFVRGDKIVFNGVEDTELTISIVPTLEAFADTDQVEFSTEQVETVINFIRPMPEKQVNDRNVNNL